jgi:hypothetical protein
MNGVIKEAEARIKELKLWESGAGYSALLISLDPAMQGDIIRTEHTM